jgi:hypothetical protein
MRDSIGSVPLFINNKLILVLDRNGWMDWDVDKIMLHFR